MLKENELIRDNAFERVSPTLNRLSKTIGPADPQLLDQLKRALLHRKNDPTKIQGQNTYLRTFEIPQIKLFDILANHFPLVLESQRMAHECLISQLTHRQHLCIIDLGVGRGVQMLRLLHQLNHVLSVQKVTLVGVDIMPDALEHTKELLEEQTTSFTFTFQFHLIHDTVESMDFNRISALLPSDRDFTYVNASLTLHHIQKAEDRDAIFRHIKGLSPDLLTLIEPNASTFTDDYDLRADRAIEHFYALYDYTDTLSLTSAEKRALKTFFGNDFFDPIAYPDASRFEKLERGEEWIARASAAGLSPFSPPEGIIKNKIDNIDLLTDAANYMNFQYKGVDLLSLIHLR